jgi:hypothetical protein
LPVRLRCVSACCECLERCRWVESACSAGGGRLEFGGKALPVQSRCAGSGFSRRPWAQLRAVGGWPWYSVCHVVSNDMEWTWRSAYKELRAVRRKRLTAGRNIFLPSHYPPSRITFTLIILSSISQCAASLFVIWVAFFAAPSATQEHRLSVRYSPPSPPSPSKDMRCFVDIAPAM